LDFSSPLIDDSTLTGLLYYHNDDPFPDNFYRWRARAGNSSSWSVWSDYKTFRVDTEPPYGSVASSPETSGCELPVYWTAGRDPQPASGIAYYYVRVKDVTLSQTETWLFYATDTSAIFDDGIGGHTYVFEAIAYDYAGNSEVRNTVDECSTYVDESLCDVLYKYLPGDANMRAGLWPPQVQLSDLVYLVNFTRGMNSGCLNDSLYCAADINGDCNVAYADITSFIGYFRGEVQIGSCPGYETQWPFESSCPANQPLFWPGCE